MHKYTHRKQDEMFDMRERGEERRKRESRRRVFLFIVLMAAAARATKAYGLEGVPS